MPRLIIVLLWMAGALSACGRAELSSPTLPPAASPTLTRTVAPTRTATPTLTAAPARTPTLAPTRNPTRTAAPPAVASAAPPVAPSEVVITLPPAAPVISAAVGQIIRVLPPDSASEWNISYSDQILSSLTAADHMRSPGPAGWRFRALSPGQADLMITSRPAPCPTRQPCSPPVMQFTFTINIRAQ